MAFNSDDSATVCYSPIYSKLILYKWDPGRLMLEGAMLQPSDTSLPGLAGAHLCGLDSPLEGKPFPALPLHWACFNWSELLQEHFLLWLLETGSSAGLSSFP